MIEIVHFRVPPGQCAVEARIRLRIPFERSRATIRYEFTLSSGRLAVRPTCLFNWTRKYTLFGTPGRFGTGMEYKS